MTNLPATYVEVPARVSRAFTRFTEHGRVRVTGTIDGHPLHATRDHLDLGFWFTERDVNQRFWKIETFAPNAHVHRAKIRTLDELDDEARGWIDRAYRVGCREHLR